MTAPSYQRLVQSAGFMLNLIDKVYGTDNEGMDLPEEAEYRRNAAVIHAAIEDATFPELDFPSVERLAEALHTVCPTELYGAVGPDCHQYADAIRAALASPDKGEPPK